MKTRQIKSAKSEPTEVQAEAEESQGLHLPPKSRRPTFSSGCHVIDLHLGGGWCAGQMIRFKGDTGTGKSLLAIEAAANFVRAFAKQKPKVRYKDTENAFETAYVEDVLGISTKSIELPECEEVSNTVESVMMDVDMQIEKRKGKPLLYVVDSWDGVSDETEVERRFDDSATYGAAKAKKGSEFGRRVIGTAGQKNFTFLVTQQIRASMAKFGSPETTSGGNWIKFYATQSLHIKQGDRLSRSHNGVTRNYGRWTKCTVQKNRRVGESPELQIPIIYGYGIDDLMACVKYLLDTNRASDFFKDAKGKDANEKAKSFINGVWKLSPEKYDTYLEDAKHTTTRVYSEITTAFRPRRRKYH